MFRAVVRDGRGGEDKQSVGVFVSCLRFVTQALRQGLCFVWCVVCVRMCVRACGWA
eukprot:m.19410 g.19410  ORF g.19410 m.19410 type:complete len:56 (+) comp5931_c0_seq1:6578-6745(+)